MLLARIKSQNASMGAVASIDRSRASTMEFTPATSLTCRKVNNSTGFRKMFDSGIAGSAILVGQRVYLLGGSEPYDGRDSRSHKLRILDHTNRTWTEIDIPDRAMRSSNCTFVYNDYIYVFSGTSKGWIEIDLFRVDLLENCAVEFIRPDFKDLSVLRRERFAGSFCEPFKELVVFVGKDYEGRASNLTFCFKVDTGLVYAPACKG